LGNNTWANSLDPFANSRATIVNTFTTARDVYGGGTAAIPLPYTAADELKVGTMVRLEAVGALSTTGTPTFRAGFAYGINTAGAALSTGVELAGNALTATTTTGAAWPVILWYLGRVTAVGSAGVLYGQGTIAVGSSLTAFGTPGYVPMPVTAAARSATINTTTKNTWTVFAEFGTSNAANQIQIDVFNVTVINQGKPGQT
jgi:hypothetical protein